MDRHNVLAVKHACVVGTALLILWLSGCNREETDQEYVNAVRVTVAMPIHGAAFRTVGRRLVDFSQRKPRIASGRRIDVVQVYPREDMFGSFVAENHSIYIVVCDSPEQLASNAALRHDAVANSANACGPSATCPAFMTPWVPPEKREAVEQVFQAIISQ